MLIGFTAFAVLISGLTVSAKKAKTIVETAVESGRFTILSKVIEAAGLIDVLKEKYT